MSEQWDEQLLWVEPLWDIYKRQLESVWQHSSIQQTIDNNSSYSYSYVWLTPSYRTLWLFSPRNDTPYLAFKALKQQEKNLVSQYSRLEKFARAFIARFASPETNVVSYKTLLMLESDTS